MTDHRLPTRSRISELTGPDFFCWATGIEDTFITAPHAGTGRTLDEYDLTDHYRRWREDLDLMSGLGVKAARYGVPWHRIQPEPHRWEWHHADEPLERLLELGISPQVDLVHYGLPPWINRAYLDPDYPNHVAEYAARLAERFRGRIHWYTPLNEPRITAWYCGRLGWWPPYERSWKGFARVLVNVAAGIQKTVIALRSADPEIVAYHVDATDLYETSDPSCAAEAELRQNIVYLPLELVSGQVDQAHPLHDWLTRHMDRLEPLEALQSHAQVPDVIGLNLYPLFTHKQLKRGAGGRLSIRMPYTEQDLIENVARGYHRRFGRPMMISEVATSGTAARRLRWLERSVNAVRTVRSEGIPVMGYTWWPMFALVAWAWRQGHRPVSEHLLQMGLWDLDDGLNRIPTPLVSAFRTLVAQGVAPVGPFAAQRGSSEQEFV